MSNRIEKVNSLLEHEVGNILLRDFNFQGSLVTLTRVEATGNLIEAKAYISVMPEENSKKIIDVLEKAVYDVQKKIDKKLNMRPVPKIIFVADENIKEATRVEELLEQLKKEKK